MANIIAVLCSHIHLEMCPVISDVFGENHLAKILPASWAHVPAVPSLLLGPCGLPKRARFTPKQPGKDGSPPVFAAVSAQSE